MQISIEVNASLDPDLLLVAIVIPVKTRIHFLSYLRRNSSYRGVLLLIFAF